MGIALIAQSDNKKNIKLGNELCASYKYWFMACTYLYS